jgi:hypothetical protein
MVRVVEWREQIFEEVGLAPRFRPDLHQARVHDDAMNPGSQGGVAFKAAERLVCGEERILNRIGGFVLTMEQTSSQGQHAACIPSDKLGEGIVIAQGNAGLIGFSQQSGNGHDFSFGNSSAAT